MASLAAARATWCTSSGLHCRRPTCTCAFARLRSSPHTTCCRGERRASATSGAGCSSASTAWSCTASAAARRSPSSASTPASSPTRSTRAPPRAPTTGHAALARRHPAVQGPARRDRGDPAHPRGATRRRGRSRDDGVVPRECAGHLDRIGQALVHQDDAEREQRAPVVGARRCTGVNRVGMTRASMPSSASVSRPRSLCTTTRSKRSSRRRQSRACQPCGVAAGRGR